jgi:hypothetical protein
LKSSRDRKHPRLESQEGLGSRKNLFERPQSPKAQRQDLSETQQGSYRKTALERSMNFEDDISRQKVKFMSLNIRKKFVFQLGGKGAKSE